MSAFRMNASQSRPDKSLRKPSIVIRSSVTKSNHRIAPMTPHHRFIASEHFKRLTLKLRQGKRRRLLPEIHHFPIGAGSTKIHRLIPKPVLEPIIRFTSIDKMQTEDGFLI